MSFIRVAFLLLLPCLSGFTAVAQPQSPAPPERQALIVLLDAESRGAPPAEEVVREVNGGGPSPGQLPLGNPHRADFGITRRAQGNVKAWLRNHPDVPLARLHRYVVLEYPQHANLDAIAEALRKHPHVLHVERDQEGRFSSASNPNDPFLVFDPNPVNYQWGHYALNVPAAWELTGGHGYVGLADSGVQVDHPDLRAFHTAMVGETEVLVYDGGNLRTHLAWDFGDNDANVDELGPGITGDPPSTAGHGTHLAGLIAATVDNGIGGAGVCQHCSVVPNKMRTSRGFGFESKLADTLQGGTDIGVQVQSVSLGFVPQDCNSPTASYGLVCTALAFAKERQVLVVAASGNDRAEIDSPANDPRVMAIGGIESNDVLWDEFPDCPFVGEETECGSNFSVGAGSATQSLVAPAKSVLSTFYEGQTWNDIAECGDFYHPAPGYSPCTGTSMAAPYVAGIAGILRSANPLLSDTTIRRALESTASLGYLSVPNDKLGYGIPDAHAATVSVLGSVDGAVLPNRLTPLFSFYSAVASTHLYTTVPQMASAAVFDCQAPFVSEGPQVPGYERFPSVSEEPCPFSGCEPIVPRAAVYIFTTDVPVFEDEPPLVPLYRMSYDPDFATRCREGIEPPAQIRRGYFYTTDERVLLSAKKAGYELDGREGYIYSRCTPEPDCIPEGAVRLYRLYHPGRDDYVLLPESELATWQALGYVVVGTLADYIGYVYPNQDSDFDFVIDGFERLAGMDPARADSDCDSIPDGEELLGVAPLQAYSDPTDGLCNVVPGDPIFADDFEQGDLLKWNVFSE